MADASHELCAPIANIRVALEVALAYPNQADWLALSDEVLTQDGRMGRLVDDLLLLARGDDDPAQRHDEALDLGEIVQQVVGQAAPLDNHQVSVRITRCDSGRCSPRCCVHHPSTHASLGSLTAPNAVPYVYGRERRSTETR